MFTGCRTHLVDSLSDATNPFGRSGLRPKLHVHFVGLREGVRDPAGPRPASLGGSLLGRRHAFIIASSKTHASASPPLAWARGPWTRGVQGDCVSEQYPPEEAAGFVHASPFW